VTWPSAGSDRSTNQQSQFEISIWRHALQLSPVRKLGLIRELQRAANAQAPTTAESTLPGTPDYDREYST